MPNAKYLLSLGGSFLLGAAIIIVSLIATFMLLPYLMPMFAGLFPWFVGALLVFVIFIFVLIVVYICVLVGVLIRYLFKPLEVSKEPKGYSIAKVRESGLRGKGQSKKKK